MERMVTIHKLKSKSLSHDTIQIEIKSENQTIKKFLHSPYFPEKEAERWAEGVFSEKYETYLILGMGYLYHILALKSLLTKKKSEAKIIILDPFTQLVEFLENEDRFSYLEELEGIIVIKEMEGSIIRSIFNKHIKKKDREHISIQIYPPYKDLDLENEKLLFECLRDTAVRSDLLDNTMKVMKEPLVENFIKNAKYVMSSSTISDWKDMFVGHTAVIVSAGPSLEKNIQQLKSYQDKVIIITGGRSTRALVDRQIHPHFICSLDSHEDNYLLYQKMDILEYEIPMVTTWGNHYKIVEQYEGKKIFLNDLFIEGFDDLLAGKVVDSLPIAMTVASLQMMMAIHMGCKNIIFVGQDLAFSEGKIHSEIASTVSAIENQTEEGIFVKGNIEDRVRTSYPLNAFRHYFEEVIGKLDSNHLFINSTEGGAYIQGTMVMPLKDSLVNYSKNVEFPYQDLIEKKLTNKDSDSSINELRNNLEAMYSDCRKLYQYAQEGSILSAKLSENGSQNNNIIKRLDSLDEKIDVIKNNTAFINYLLQSEIRLITEDMKEKLDSKDIIQSNKLLYQSLAKAAKKVYRIIQEEIDLLSRID